MASRKTSRPSRNFSNRMFRSRRSHKLLRLALLAFAFLLVFVVLLGFMFVGDDHFVPRSGTVAVADNPFFFVDRRISGRVWIDDGILHVSHPNTSLGAMYPLIEVVDLLDLSRKHHNASKWERLYSPREEFVIPVWASPQERNTVTHASIFVSIAAFRDSDCPQTLLQLFSRARNRHRIYVGLSEERNSDDVDCLSLLGLNDPNLIRQLLWGTNAPESLNVERRSLTWSDVVGSQRQIITVEATVAGENATGGDSSKDTPAGVYLLSSYESESITCLSGALESMRDTYLGMLLSRRGRGGPQLQPSQALAGCRVTSRVASIAGARGPTFGRYITSLFYFKQDYYMVIDSHSRFSVHWDAKLIARVFQMPTRGILSNYPNGYQKGNDEAEFNLTHTMIMCSAVLLDNGMPKLGAAWSRLQPRPILQGFAAAGFMFGDAQFSLEVPFDPLLTYLFDGEESLYSSRLWTSGWDIYGPAEANVFHNYNRGGAPRFWSVIPGDWPRLRQLAEKRALYLMRRGRPWIRYSTSESPNPSTGVAGSTTTNQPSYERFVVSEAEAAALPAISAHKVYYGMGQRRTLEAYWSWVGLRDDQVVSKDGEDRWKGAETLCLKRVP